MGSSLERRNDDCGLRPPSSCRWASAAAIRCGDSASRFQGPGGGTIIQSTGAMSFCLHRHQQRRAGNHIGPTRDICEFVGRLCGAVSMVVLPRNVRPQLPRTWYRRMDRGCMARVGRPQSWMAGTRFAGAIWGASFDRNRLGDHWSSDVATARRSTRRSRRPPTSATPASRTVARHPAPDRLASRSFAGCKLDEGLVCLRPKCCADLVRRMARVAFAEERFREHISKCR